MSKRWAVGGILSILVGASVLPASAGDSLYGVDENDDTDIMLRCSDNDGVAHPICGDTSNSAGDNPDGTANFDSVTDQVTGGPTAPPPTPAIPLLEVGPYLGGFFFDSALPIHDGPLIGGRLAFNVGGRWALETEVGITFTEDNSGEFGVVLPISENVLFHLLPRPAPMEPYLTAGVGTLIFAGFSSDDARLAGNFGGGAKFDLAPDMDLRIDVRDYLLDDAYGSGTTNNLQVTLGLVFSIF